ncbi:MAG: hypothetical protein KDD28_29525, partial [Phaeodactylibacter sp.]|nr:hypothetical protein [Phaeodactylibacter sp.]
MSNLYPLLQSGHRGAKIISATVCAENMLATLDEKHIVVLWDLSSGKQIEDIVLAPHKSVGAHSPYAARTTTKKISPPQQLFAHETKGLFAGGGNAIYPIDIDTLQPEKPKGLQPGDASSINIDQALTERLNGDF